jgi:hypothetical protein
VTLRAPRSAALFAAAVAALALAGVAGAKSFTLIQADVTVNVAKDGSLNVAELISYSFSGPFSGAYRDIPLRSGESIRNVMVLEGGRPYRTGGCTELGCADSSGTFGVATVGDESRVGRMSLRSRYWWGYDYCE